jgi:DNA-binding response OmpR family regulator
LDLLGNEVRTAVDGMAALAVAESFRPHIVFLDVEVPQLDGYDVCRAIRSRPWGAGIRILALTGWSEKKHRRRAAEVGFDRYLLKPVEMDVLNDVLGTLPRSAGRPVL